MWPALPEDPRLPPEEPLALPTAPPPNADHRARGRLLRIALAGVAAGLLVVACGGDEPEGADPG